MLKTEENGKQCTWIQICSNILCTKTAFSRVRANAAAVNSINILVLYRFVYYNYFYTPGSKVTRR